MSLVRCSVADATWRAYKRVWQELLELVSIAGGCSSDDNRLQVLLYFLGKNCEDGVSVTSVNRKISGLAFLFQLDGVRDVTKAFIVRKALRGYRKGRCKPDSRWPVFLGMLGVMVGTLPQICLSAFEAQLFWTAFVLAFFGALRLDELVSPSKLGVLSCWMWRWGWTRLS